MAGKETAGVVESNGSLPPGTWLSSPATGCKLIMSMRMRLYLYLGQLYKANGQTGGLQDVMGLL